MGLNLDHLISWKLPTDHWPGILTDLTVTNQRLVYHINKSYHSPHVTFSGNRYPLSDLEQLGSQFEQTQYHEPETRSNTKYEIK